MFWSLKDTLNRTVSPDEGKEILQPVLLGDVLVVLGRSFAVSMNNYATWWKIGTVAAAIGDTSLRRDLGER